MSEDKKNDSIVIETSLAFEKDKQEAIFGWCMRDAKFCEQCSHAVKPEWFTSTYVGKMYSALMKYYAKYARVPKMVELLQSRILEQEDIADRNRMQEIFAHAVKMTERYALDALRDEMTGWMHSVIFYQGMKSAATAYNAKKVDDAWKVTEDSLLLKATSSFEDGTNRGFEEAAAHLVNEAEIRMEESTRIIKYGVSYLDEALGGINPSDVIVLGAPTGRGKTQLAATIALYNAQLGKRVHYFALEAEDGEIERRVKYAALSEAFYKDPKREKVEINYRMWRMGQVEAALSKYEQAVADQVLKDLGNLKTLYRTSGTFDLKALEKNLLKIVGQTDLVIIDHLHYVDTDGDDENSSYKRVIKIVRDMALKHRVPIIVIAHLRKNQVFKNPPIVNNIDDFHGTSDVPKIATVCIMIGPKPFKRPKDTTEAVEGMGTAAIEKKAKKAFLIPTYMRIVKYRLDSDVTRYCALIDFDRRKGRYAETYKLGRLVSGDTEWIGLPEDEKPFWSTSAVPVEPGDE